MKSVIARRGTKTAAFLLAGAFAAVAYFGLSFGIARGVYRYLIFIDFTQSQLAEDYELDGKRVSRLAFVKHAIRVLLRDLPCGSEVGITLFAGRSSLPAPVPLFAPLEVCEHRAAILASLGAVETPAMLWGDGSNIGLTLIRAIVTAEELGAVTRLAFFTDGEEQQPFDYSDNIYSKEMKTRGRGKVVGVGGLARVPIPKFKNGERAGYIPDETTALAEEYLKRLVAQTGLGYHRLETAEKLSAALREPQFAHRGTGYADIRWVFGAAALILSVLAVLL